MNKEKNIENIDELILSFLHGTITSEEVVLLKAWLTDDKSNKDYFKQMFMVWKAGSISEQNSDDVNSAFQKVYLKTFEAKEGELPVINERKQSLSVTLFKWAAVIFISFSAGSVLTYMFQKNQLISNAEVAQNEINVPLGSKSLIVLPDRTEVWLNAGSKLTYSMNFGKKLREVTLEGEGYFKVSKMPDKPFIVHTLKANIKALGTEFNVKAYPDENTIETILVEGSVVVNKTNSTQNSDDPKEIKSIILKPGQKVLIFKTPVIAGNEEPTTLDPAKKQLAIDQSGNSVATKEMNPQVANSVVETSWKDPNWVIQGENLKELFVKLGRRFNVTILLENEELDKYKFSGIIESETLEQVFDLMSLTIPLSYSIEKGKVEIKLNQKLENKYKRAYHN